VRPFPDVDGGRTQVSKNGGNSPLWSPDGKELFYRNENEVISASVETTPTFKIVNSKVLFKDSYFYRPSVVGSLWDISPDGNRFIMLKIDMAQSQVPTQFNVVLNWFEELKEKAPVQ
jgi:hypothetical protein